MHIANFIKSVHIFDYNGKPYRIEVNEDRIVDVYDHFSGKKLARTTAKEIYQPTETPGLSEALFIVKVATSRNDTV